MIVNVDLTIKEIFIEMKSIKARLISLAEKYHRSTINISAINWKDIVVSGGKKGDIMLNKVIKKDKLENEFDIVKESYDAYKELAIDKIRDMLKNNSLEYCIVYFKDELHWKWEDIAKIFNYSSRHCRRKYAAFKKKS